MTSQLSFNQVQSLGGQKNNMGQNTNNVAWKCSPGELPFEADPKTNSLEKKKKRKDFSVPYAIMIKKKKPCLLLLAINAP